MQTFKMGQADELRWTESPAQRIPDWFVLEETLNLISFQPPAMGSDPFH